MSDYRFPEGMKCAHGTDMKESCGLCEIEAKLRKSTRKINKLLKE